MLSKQSSTIYFYFSHPIASRAAFWTSARINRVSASSQPRNSACKELAIRIIYKKDVTKEAQGYISREPECILGILTDTSKVTPQGCTADYKINEPIKNNHNT